MILIKKKLPAMNHVSGNRGPVAEVRKFPKNAKVKPILLVM